MSLTFYGDSLLISFLYFFHNVDYINGSSLGLRCEEIFTYFDEKYY